MDDRIEADTGRAEFDLTLLIVRCVAAAALVTATAWLIADYALDLMFR